MFSYPKQTFFIICYAHCFTNYMIYLFCCPETMTVEVKRTCHNILYILFYFISMDVRVSFTTRKLINTNENTEEIFLSVNFRGILPTELFPRYIPMELPWVKNLKQSKKKKMTCHFYQRNLPTEFSVGKFRR